MLAEYFYSHTITLPLELNPTHLTLQLSFECLYRSLFLFKMSQVYCCVDTKRQNNSTPNALVLPKIPKRALLFYLGKSNFKDKSQDIIFAHGFEYGEMAFYFKACLSQCTIRGIFTHTFFSVIDWFWNKIWVKIDCTLTFSRINWWNYSKSV